MNENIFSHLLLGALLAEVAHLAADPIDTAELPHRAKLQIVVANSARHLVAYPVDGAHDFIAAVFSSLGFDLRKADAAYLHQEAPEIVSPQLSVFKSLVNGRPVEIRI